MIFVSVFRARRAFTSASRSHAMKLCMLLAILACHASAQSLLPQFYARDERTEIALSPDDKGGASFEFRVYGGIEEGRVIFHGGDLAKAADGVLHYEAESEGRRSAVTITGKPGDDSFRVDASGIERSGGGIADVNGSYRHLTVAETLERARRRYEAADNQLNATYKTVRTELNPKRQSELRDAQRDWIVVRDERAEWAAHGADDSKAVPEYWEELLSQTVTRLEFLKVYTGRNMPTGLSGTYDDFFGGSLDLELTKAGLRFSIDVVRGPSSHLGDISGLALRRNDRLFSFKERVPEDEQAPDRLPAELTFTVVDAHRVRVVGKNTDAHHGARAYFDGLYFKTGKLGKAIELDE